MIILILGNNAYSQLSFTESSTALGISVSYGDSFHGGGVSFVDFDNDGWDDLSFSSQENDNLYFFKNNNGTFVQITLNGVSNTEKTKQIVWVDYDNDGDKDLFIAVLEGSNKFYRNDGGLNFTDITSSIGFFQDDFPTYSASFGDIDNDGDLDAFISIRDDDEVQRDYLYRNDSGVYVDITASAGIALTSELSFCSIFFDYNDDGFQDIYVSNDKPSFINRLYKNNGDGTFDDVSISSGAGIDINAMTTTLGDYNNDGWFDIYVTNTPEGNELLKNNGDGTFTNVARDSETEFNSVGWGAVFLDADLDGFEDLYVSGSLDGSNSSFLSAAFYHNQGDGTFTIPTNIGFADDTRESYSNAIGDIDNDGKPDIVVSNDTENNFLWKNETSTSNNWIKIKLEGTTGNRDGIGNKIEIKANGVSQYRYTLCGEGYLAQNSTYKFVGVGNATNIEYIKVTWKHSGVVETINNLQPNQTITIQEGNGVLNTSETIANSLSIFPNPSDDGLFNIHFNNSYSNKLVRVFDVSGRLLLSKKSTQQNDIIDLTNYASGVYVVKISSKNNLLQVVKLIHL
ncbi:MAG: VCBS repeat-containing protein [Flavobacteriaceae bacterium]